MNIRMTCKVCGRSDVWRNVTWDQMQRKAMSAGICPVGGNHADVFLWTSLHLEEVREPQASRVRQAR